MPNLDGTGPQGQGPLTGRKRGQCKDSKKTDENRERIFRRRRGGKSQQGDGFEKGQGRRKGFGRNQTFGN